MNNVLLNKTTTIDRCVKRIHEVNDGNSANLTDFTNWTVYKCLCPRI
ncbi:hypothetical protein [Bacillus sp. JJ1773]